MGCRESKREKICSTQQRDGCFTIQDAQRVGAQPWTRNSSKLKWERPSVHLTFVTNTERNEVFDAHEFENGCLWVGVRLQVRKLPRPRGFAIESLAWNGILHLCTDGLCGETRVLKSRKVKTCCKALNRVAAIGCCVEASDRVYSIANFMEEWSCMLWN